MNGQANFDIDYDTQKKQTDLFEKKLTKIEKFQDDLESLILSKNITNCDVYNYTLENGHIPKHAIPIVKKLKNDHKITYKGQPRINYDNCYKECNIIFYERLKSEKK